MDKPKQGRSFLYGRIIGFVSIACALVLLMGAIRCALTSSGSATVDNVGHQQTTGGIDVAASLDDKESSPSSMAGDATLDETADMAQSQVNDNDIRTSISDDLDYDLERYVPVVCQKTGKLVSTASNGIGARVTYRVAGNLPDIATQILQHYRADETLLLKHADYLDLFQKVWGCVLTTQSDSAILAIVDERDDGTDEASCSVIIERIGPS